MENLKEIIVGFDGSDSSIKALEEAVEIADDSSELLIVHAYSIPANLHRYPFFEELVSKSEESARDTLELAENLVPKERRNVRFEIMPGKPAQVLAELTKQHDATMVVVGNRGIGKVKSVLGSQSRLLIQLSECPVLVVPDTH